LSRLLGLSDRVKGDSSKKATAAIAFSGTRERPLYYCRSRYGSEANSAVRAERYAAGRRTHARGLRDREGTKRMEVILGASKHALRVPLAEPVTDAVRKKILTLSDRERKAMRVELASWKRARARLRAAGRKRP